MSPPGVPADVKSIGEKQRHIHTRLAKKEKRRVLQKLTQIGGVERYKDELRQALTGLSSLVSLIVGSSQGLHSIVRATFKLYTPTSATIQERRWRAAT